MKPEACRVFYDRMRQDEVPHTSQMTPLEFVEFWSGILQEYDLPIIHVAMGSAISGTYANALIARNMLLETQPEAEIFVIDSTLASIGYGMLCSWAADMRDAGETAEACVEYLNSRKILINTYYTCDDLKYLHRSGRLNIVSTAVGTILNINPILNLTKEGRLVASERVRGRKKAFRRIYELVQEYVVDPAGQTLYICHSDCKDEDVRDFSETLINTIGFVISDPLLALIAARASSLPSSLVHPELKISASENPAPGIFSVISAKIFLYIFFLRR